MTAIAATPATNWSIFWADINRALMQRGYARSTRKQYRQVLRALSGAGIKTPAAVTAQQIHALIADLAARGASWSWIAQNISVLRTTFDRIAGHSVTGGLVTPKRPFRLPEILTEDEVTDLITACTTIRDQLLLGLMYGCGLTASEVTRLRWQDIGNDGATAYIRASTRYNARALPTPEPFRQILAAGRKTCDPESCIFPGRGADRALSTRMVESILHKACRSAGQSRPVVPMTLRHSYAVHRLENGISIRVLQQELGHRSIHTTERYQRCLAPTLEKPHPFARVRQHMQKYESSPPFLPPTAPSQSDVSSERSYAVHFRCQVSDFSPSPLARPLQAAQIINLEAFELPLTPTQEPLLQAFTRMLKNKLYIGLLRHSPPPE